MSIGMLGLGMGWLGSRTLFEDITARPNSIWTQRPNSREPPWCIANSIQPQFKLKSEFPGNRKLNLNSIQTQFGLNLKTIRTQFKLNLNCNSNSIWTTNSIVQMFKELTKTQFKLKLNSIWTQIPLVNGPVNSIQTQFKLNSNSIWKPKRCASVLRFWTLLFIYD